MRKHICLMLPLLLMLVTAISANAQESFNDLELFDLRGPVEKCVIKTENPASKNDKPEFTKQGELTWNDFARNRQGKALGSGMTGLDVYSNLRIKYDDDGKFIGADEESTIGGSRSMSVSNLFEGDRISGRDIEIRNGQDVRQIRLRYSDEKLDDRDNWTSRKVIQTETDKNGKTKESEYMETRQISYY